MAWTNAFNVGIAFEVYTKLSNIVTGVVSSNAFNAGIAFEVY